MHQMEKRFASSDGLPEIGDFDIYFSRYSDETKSWSKDRKPRISINTSRCKRKAVSSFH